MNTQLTETTDDNANSSKLPVGVEVNKIRMSHHLNRFVFPPEMNNFSEAPYYFIQGNSADSVITAYNFLLGLSMCQIMFIVPSDTEFSQAQILQWKNEFLVDVKIEYYYDALLKKPIKRANLRFFEFCCKYAYTIRSEILKNDKYVINDDYIFMDEIRNLIPSTVFDNCQLFFPSNFCDVDFHKKVIYKSKADGFCEFYGRIPRFGLEINLNKLQVDCLFSQIPSTDARMFASYVTPQMCGDANKERNEIYMQYNECYYNQFVQCIPVVTVLPPTTYMPAILSGTSDSNDKELVFYSVSNRPRHSGQCNFGSEKSFTAGLP